jgi:NAD-dependent SIR2 family protein deacetylase
MVAISHLLADCCGLGNDLGDELFSADFVATGLTRACLEADLFVSIGTSGSVYPAAGFVEQAKAHGIGTCEINLEPSDNARQFNEGR